jgi:hypothetical protein
MSDVAQTLVSAASPLMATHLSPVSPLSLSRLADRLNVGEILNNQVLNAMGMEGGQKVFVVLVHPAPFSSP